MKVNKEEKRTREEIIIDNIIELMKERGISQKQYAKDNNFTQSVISNWKSKKSIGINYINQACEYFSVPIERIFYSKKELDNIAFEKMNPDYKHIMAQKVEKVMPFNLQIPIMKKSMVLVLISIILMMLITLIDINSLYLRIISLLVSLLLVILIVKKTFYKKDYIVNYSDEIIFKIDDSKNKFYNKALIMRIVSCISTFMLVLNSTSIIEPNFEMNYMIILSLLYVIFNLIAISYDNRVLKKEIYYYEINEYFLTINTLICSLGYIYLIVRLIIDINNWLFVLLLSVNIIVSFIIFIAYSNNYQKYKAYYIDKDKKYHELSDF